MTKYKITGWIIGEGMKIINNITEKLIDDMQTEVTENSKLSIAAACFSVYAYKELKIPFLINTLKIETTKTNIQIRIMISVGHISKQSYQILRKSQIQTVIVITA